MIPFAKNNEEFTEIKFTDYLHDYLDFSVKVIIAEENPEQLKQQIIETHYIYIVGGDYNSLFEKIHFLKNEKNIFQNKIIAGSSAGVNILSNFSFSNDYQKITY